MKKAAIITMLIGLFSIMAGCGNDSVQPVAIDEGVDVCEVCNMSVADNAFATQLATAEGRVYKFDDIGCMQEWLHQHQDTEIKAQFVRDQNNAAWTDSSKAFYVFDPSFRTPMGYGVYSFQDKAAAEQLIQKEGKGKLMTGEELSGHEWTRQSGDMQDLKKQIMNEQQQQQPEQPVHSSH